MGFPRQINRVHHGTNTVILLGANLNKPEFQIRTAVEMISASCGLLIRSSSLYRSSAWGYTEQNNFLNLAVLMHTPWSPKMLLRRLQHIEQRMGRTRDIPLGPRVIDLDILVYGQRLIKAPELQVPHRYLPERRFALIPLMEIWPDWKHPELGSNAVEMLKTCKDQGKVIRL